MGGLFYVLDKIVAKIKNYQASHDHTVVGKIVGAALDQGVSVHTNVAGPPNTSIHIGDVPIMEFQGNSEKEEAQRRKAKSEKEARLSDREGGA